MKECSARTAEEILEWMQDWFEDSRHWIKGGLADNDADGMLGMCMMGAARCATGSWLLFNINPAQDGLLQMYELLTRVMREQFPGRMGKYWSIPHFNDHEETTIADVRLVVGKALVLAREQTGIA